MNTRERVEQLSRMMTAHPETDIIELIRYMLHFELGYVPESVYTADMIFEALDAVDGKDLFHRGRVRKLPYYYCPLDGGRYYR